MPASSSQQRSSPEAAAAAAIAGAGAFSSRGTPRRRAGGSVGKGRRRAPGAGLSISAGSAAAAAAAAGGSGNTYEKGRESSTASTARVISMPGKESHKRVAQACDRCRSKKIRCDGRQPSCSQCAAVGFDCQTSDKLSRRAFPRGYTEMLEESVNDVKAQNAELLGLLQEREAQLRVLGVDREVLLQCKGIDPGRRSSASSASSGEGAAPTRTAVIMDGENEMVHWETGPLEPPSQNVPFAGLSSVRAYCECLLRRVAGNLQFPSFSVDEFLTLPVTKGPDPQMQVNTQIKDQLLKTFLTEWAPFFPVVHGPTITHACNMLKVNTPSSDGRFDYAIVQLNIIWGIVCSSTLCFAHSGQQAVFEAAWLPLLDDMENEVRLETAQAFMLAQIYHLVRSEYPLVLRYRGIACAICHQLGMHWSEARFQHERLTSQLRRRVFWTQYVLDRFTAAFTGLPVLLDDSEISTEYPDEVGDVSPPNGERCSLAGFLAVIQLSRILTQALEVLYPQSGTLTVSLSMVHELSKNLEKWRDSLPPDLHFELGKDRQDDNKSPILGLLYCIIRVYIRRPSLCSDDKHHLCPALQAVAESGRYIINLVQFLDQHAMVLPMCVSRRTLLLFAGVGLVWYASKKQPENKHMKEAEKLVKAAVSLAVAEKSHGISNFAALVDALFVHIRGGLWLGTEQEQGAQHQEQEMEIDTLMTDYSVPNHQQQFTATDEPMLPLPTGNHGVFDPQATLPSTSPRPNFFTLPFQSSQTSISAPASADGHSNRTGHASPHLFGHARARTQVGIHSQVQAHSCSPISNGRRWSTPGNLDFFAGAGGACSTPNLVQSSEQLQQDQPGQAHLNLPPATLGTAAATTAMGHMPAPEVQFSSAMPMTMPTEQIRSMGSMSSMSTVDCSNPTPAPASYSDPTPVDRSNMGFQPYVEYDANDTVGLGLDGGVELGSDVNIEPSQLHQHDIHSSQIHSLKQSSEFPTSQLQSPVTVMGSMTGPVAGTRAGTEIGIVDTPTPATATTHSAASEDENQNVQSKGVGHDNADARIEKDDSFFNDPHNTKFGDINIEGIGHGLHLVDSNPHVNFNHEPDATGGKIDMTSIGVVNNDSSWESLVCRVDSRIHDGIYGGTDGTRNPAEMIFQPGQSFF